jgi:hypothetical protein
MRARIMGGTAMDVYDLRDRPAAVSLPPYTGGEPMVPGTSLGAGPIE